MWSYILRRLLLMIPTLFGVTVVSFVIMQMAPGDPLLAQLDAGGAGGQSTQTREVYLLQKRDLKLDLPLLINLRDFEDYRQPLLEAAHFLAETQAQVVAELPSLAEPAGAATQQARLKYLRSLPIKDFDAELADSKQHAALAQKILAYVREYCENLGRWGVPAAIGILQSDIPRAEKIGTIRALEHMVPDPFSYTFSRSPQPAEAPEVETTWRIWWQRTQSQFAPIDPDRKPVLDEQLKAMAAEPSREKVFEQLENFDRDDTPFFMDVLLGDRPLKEKSIAAMFLLLYNNKPLEVDVPLDATDEQTARVAENWIAHFEARSAAYHPSTARKLWDVVAETQYSQMLWRLVTFNFGRSALKTREPVSEKIWNGFVVSAPLMLMAELLIYGAAIPLGIGCAINRGRWIDRLLSLGLFVLNSIPSFVAGMLFLLYFCYGDYLKWFPVDRLHSDGSEGFDWGHFLLDYLWHCVLPVICLALSGVASLAMYARSSVLDVLHQDYVRTARAKGLPQRTVIFKHVLRNALIPIITLFSSFLPAMLGGSVLVEYLFNIPGMGRLSFASIEQKDFPTQMALIYIDAIVVLLSILATDLLYVIVDPRISFESQGAAK